MTVTFLDSIPQAKRRALFGKGYEESHLVMSTNFDKAMAMMACFYLIPGEGGKESKAS